MQQGDNFNCPVCWEVYNSTERIPTIIPSCGHTLCSFCLKKMQEAGNLRCPLDKRKISNDWETAFPINLLARDLLEAKGKWAHCKSHGEKKKFFCMKDQISICSHCSIFGECKDHEVKLIAEFEPKILEKKSELKGFAENLEKSHNDLVHLIEGKQHAIQGKMSEFLKRQKAALEMKFFELSMEVDSFFSKELTRSSSSIGEKSVLGKDLAEKLKEYEHFTKAESPLHFLEQDISHFKTSIADSVDQLSQSFENRFQQISDSIDKILKDIDFSSQIEACLTLSEVFESVKQTETPNNKQEVLDPNAFSLLKFSSQLKITESDGSVDIRKTYISEDNLPFSFDPNSETQINAISFSFEDFKLSDRTFLALKSLKKKLKNLKKVTFETHATTAHEFDRAISSCFWNPAAIEEITFNLSNTHFTDGNLAPFFKQILPQMHNLTVFSVKLYGTPISCETINSLIDDTFPNLKNLKMFHLILSQTHIKQETLLRLISSIPVVPNLLLGLGNLPIFDEELEALAKTLTTFNNLQYFELGLWSTKITVAGIKTLFSSIPESIQNLRIGFRLTDITEDCVNDFLDNKLKTLKELEHLELNLEETSVEDGLKTKIREICEKLIEGSFHNSQNVVA